MKKATSKTTKSIAKPPKDRQRVELNGRMKQAELSLQRGDFENAKTLILTRLSQGANDFKTHNLLGICYANLHEFEKAATVFEKLRTQAHDQDEGERILHNLALIRLYQDLAWFGDLSVLNHPMAMPPVGMSAPLTSRRTPFAASVTLWQRALEGQSSRYAEVAHCYIAYAYLQQGDMERALDHICESLQLNENFFVSQYVLGKMFMDLVQLGLEGNDYFLQKKYKVFFEIDDNEIVCKVNDLFHVRRETFLDIGMQAFLDARELNTYSPEIMLGLAQSYLMAGMFEDADQLLSTAESLAPDALPILDLHLLLFEQSQPDPAVLKAMVARISQIRRRGYQHQVHYLIPPYYLV